MTFLRREQAMEKRSGRWENWLTLRLVLFVGRLYISNKKNSRNLEYSSDATCWSGCGEEACGDSNVGLILSNLQCVHIFSVRSYEKLLISDQFLP